MSTRKKLTCPYVFFVPDILVDKNTTCHKYVCTRQIIHNTNLNRCSKAELLQLNCTQFPSLGIFIIKKVGNQKN